MVKSRRWLPAAAVFPLALIACTSTAGRPGAGTGTTGGVAGSSSAAPGRLTTLRHVWVIELENHGYAQSFGTPSADPYLARTLPRLGALLKNYYAIGHSSAANYIAQISGQAPNLATQIDCPASLPGVCVTYGGLHDVDWIRSRQSPLRFGDLPRRTSNTDAPLGQPTTNSDAEAMVSRCAGRTQTMA